MKLIRDNLEAELALGGSSYMDCFRFSHNKIALRTWTGILIQAYVSDFSSTCIVLSFVPCQMAAAYRQ